MPTNPPKPPTTPPLLILGGTTVDLVSRHVQRPDKSVELTPKEAELLAFFAAHPHQVLSREQLYREVWGYRGGVHSRTLDTTTCRLRTKIELDPAQPQHLLTLHGGGYRFVPLAPAHPPAQVGPSLPSAAAPQTTPARAPLVARASEYAFLEQRWQAACAGQAHLVVLEGEAGIGKTRLAEALEDQVRAQGAAVAVAVCYGVEGTLGLAPLLPILLEAPLETLSQVWRQELARLTPALLERFPDLERPEPLTEPWQRQRLFEALARALLCRQPLLLVVEDIQWCDRETLEWLHFVLRFQPGARLLLLATLRSGTSVPGDPLSWLLATLERSRRLHRLGLLPLGQHEIAQLARSLGVQTVDTALEQRLFQETEGNPLFLVELVHGGLLEHPHSGTLRLPSSLEALFALRLAALSQAAQRVLEVAAVIRRKMPLSLLAEASGLEHAELLQALLELQSREILREPEPEVCAFTHGKLAELAYARLPSAGRRLRHLQVAKALEHASTPVPDALAGTLAGHWEAAGLPHRAVPYYLQAGQAAQRVFAHEEALHSFDQVLRLLKSPGDEALRWIALTGRQELNALAGRLDAARQDLDAMEALAQMPGQDLWLAIVRCRQGRLAYRRGDSQKALHLAREAQTLARACGAVEAEIEAWQIATLACARDLIDVQAVIEEQQQALTLSRARGLLQAECRLLNSLAYLYPLVDRLEDARRAADQAVVLAQTLGDRASLSQLSLRPVELRLFDGQFEEALELVEPVLRLTQEIQNRVHALAARYYQGVIYLYLHRLDDARASIRTALELNQVCQQPFTDASCALTGGMIALELGAYSTAETRLNQALNQYQALQAPRSVALAWTQLARLWVLSLPPELARARLEHALAPQEVHAAPLARAALLHGLGRVWNALGDRVLAQSTLEEALQLCLPKQDPWLREELLDIQVSLAEVLLARAQAGAALELLQAQVPHCASLHPQRAYLRLGEALLAVGETERARHALQTAYDHVLRLLAGVSSPEEQRALREAVAIHREILELYRRVFGQA